MTLLHVIVRCFFVACQSYLAVKALSHRERLILYRLGNVPRKNTASLLPRCERLMSGDRATENARLWGRILEQCAVMRLCNTASSIASSTYRHLVRRLRPHQLRSTFDAVSWDDLCQMGVQLYLDSTTSEHLASCLCVKAPN